MRPEELNHTLSELRQLLENDEGHNGAISLKLLEIIEMLVDRREEDSLLIKDKLERITGNQK